MLELACALYAIVLYVVEYVEFGMHVLVLIYGIGATYVFELYVMSILLYT